MNWIDFFFGWLTKGQYEISMLDGIMFWLEFIVLFIAIYTIKEFIHNRKNKR